ncbi:MAG: FtsX-like permease family protein [Treponema sp.]|nr:FtsX-like permease family protein [Treponema sp.]
MKTISLALRNLTRNKRRNAILAIAIAFGFFVVTAIDGLTTGMVGNMENQITQLVGGNVITQGLEWLPPETEGGKAKIVNIVRDRDYIKNIVDRLGIKYDYYSCFTSESGQLIFNGKKSVAQLYGRDLTEKVLLDSFKFVSGGINPELENGLIISDKTADSMNLQVGDQVIFSTNTVYGQNTFADMTVMGIIKSNSFINTMQAYCDIEDLNKIIEMPEGGYSMFSLYLKDKNQQTKAAMMIENAIHADHEKNPEINATSRLEAMKTNPANIGRGIEKQLDVRKPENEWKGVKYGVETLYDEIPQIKTVLNIVHVITTVILIVILLIVMVGVSNTYRMVLYERIREIGTMRALGMTGKDTRRIFTNEAVILCVIGALAGLIFAGIVMFIVHLIPITNESLSFFLSKGHFSFKLSILSIIIQYIILIVLTTLAVRGSAKQAARMSPAEALRTVK